jgi:hypothetical protein
VLQLQTSQRSLAVRVLALLIADLTITVGLPPSAVQAAGNDYPWPTADPGQMSPLRFNRNCTDFVAWRLNTQVGVRSAPLAVHLVEPARAKWRRQRHRLERRCDQQRLPRRQHCGGRGGRLVGRLAGRRPRPRRGGDRGQRRRHGQHQQYNAIRYAYSTQNNIRAEKYLHIADGPMGGGRAPSKPAFQRADGRIDVFVVNNSAQLAHRTLSLSSGWSAWETLGNGIRPYRY